MRSLSFGIVFLASVLLAGCLGNNTIVDPNVQLTSDTTFISSYVKLNAPNAIKIPSGVWYEIDTVGTGYYPNFSDTISVTYKGKILSSGTLFDSSTSPVDLNLVTLIAGWQIGLPKFREGSYGKLFIPSGLAYGSSTASGVPANSSLLFEIKVKKVSGYKTKSDIAAIDKYLTDNSIQNVIQDNSGIRYTINTLGTGSYPKVTDKVTVTYTGKLLKAPNTVFNSTASPTEYYLPGLVNAWGIILPKIPVGSAITMYVPSGMAYDIFTNVAGVPANSNVIFDITLVSTRH
jgi:FKBP-type peptidyl-prolyl cis-trans isomerase